MATTVSSILALDVGDKRIGLAIASSMARLPRPLTTLEQGDGLFDELKRIIEAENVTRLVVGLPRGMSGQSTAQTQVVEHFAEQLKQELNLPLDLQDEALTSQYAEQELSARGKPYQKADVDALAASLILQDWLVEHTGVAL